MPLFSYKAKDRQGREVNGVLEAVDEEELARKLREEGRYLIEASERKGEGVRRGGGALFGPRIKRRELITFSTHLASAFSAGVPILQALEDYERRVQNPAFKRVIGDVIEKVRGGASLSDALAGHPDVFPEVYVNVVRVGEASGNIEEVLTDLASFMEWQEDLERNVKQLITYPAFVFTVISGIILVLITFVYPRIGGVFERLGVQIPLIARVMLFLNDLIRGYIGLALAAFLLLLISFYMLRRSARGRALMDSLLLKLPLLGETLKKIEISRFVHHLGILQRAGIDISRSLQLAGEAVRNSVIAERIARAREGVISGKQLSEALAETGIFPDLVIRMIAIGEIGGELEENLDKVRRYYDREVPAAIKRTLSVMEPLLIMFLATGVLLIAFSMYVPIYRMIRQLK
ncbi:hypothetical protein DRP77_09815 [Candidatus Poribacteria bacterium]|nr:MAG: hypothetical protein DRP77_09815 [Candidatus Poribacteria bacterium]